MDLELKGKRAIITGATRGMGKAMAEAFAAEGCNLSICGLIEEETNEMVESLKAKGVDAYGATIDIRDEQVVKDWVAKSAEQLGGLDIMVSNVGAMAFGAEKPAWEKNMGLDVFGLVNLVEAGVGFLEESAKKYGDAAIIATGSTAGTHATNPSAYGAMKAAVVHYTKGLAKQLAPKQIRVNVVSPGMIFFESGVWGKIKREKPENYQAAISKNPMGRMGKTSEVANAAVFLASPKASFVTGINMIVDGALTDKVHF
ncbi:MAG: SDR family oxidoreductase [Deltaproteobacteria bacterium]|jgi:3-oxoacyl-[acyl-carrier protein] reductase|nr:SDR family oxidoreductase [Deltaproteobacteria bacterium]MBT4267176.1 SDR family oxidoreductase [Deltaproteobacteria bacterium]MBT4642076.1 SDR family oxidoreductase [Deltaproteobacteria bacterium]MBT6499089.1 SDR family oxidoreductase [Deltaproteobacteria bacterium]MBT7152980.1 SDR family oxidoreductase [Deltaproteobacteria bacterium]